MQRKAAIGNVLQIVALSGAAKCHIQRLEETSSYAHPYAQDTRFTVRDLGALIIGWMSDDGAGAQRV